MIPADRPRLLWRLPLRRQSWWVHAGLLISTDGARRLTAIDAFSGETRWELTLPGPSLRQEIHSISRDLLAVWMSSEPRDSVVRVTSTGELAGVDALESQKPGVSWIHADGRGGYVEAHALGYDSRLIRMRSATGKIVDELEAQFLGVRDGEVLVRLDDPLRNADEGEYALRANGAFRWRTRCRPDRDVRLAGPLFLFEDGSDWNEWAEQPDSVPPAPRIDIRAHSLADGSQRWTSSLADPMIGGISTDHVLMALGMEPKQLHRIALADGTALPDVVLPGELPRPNARFSLVAMDARYLLYESGSALFCVPAGAPTEIAWRLEHGLASPTWGWSDGIVVATTVEETCAFGAI